MTQVNIGHLRDIAEIEFADIVKATIIPDVNELRIILQDESFVDVDHPPQALREFLTFVRRKIGPTK
jgi:hypothetical protein